MSEYTLMLEIEVEGLKVELAEAERHIEALRDKVNSEDCACAFDTPDDICMAHSPTVNDLKRQLAAAERERDHWKTYSSGQGKLIESGVFVSNDDYARLAAAEAKIKEYQLGVAQWKAVTDAAETARRDALNEALALICDYPDAYYRLYDHICALAEKT